VGKGGKRVEREQRKRCREEMRKLGEDDLGPPGGGPEEGGGGGDHRGHHSGRDAHPATGGHRTALHYTALHCTALHCTRGHATCWSEVIRLSRIVSTPHPQSSSYFPMRIFCQGDASSFQPEIMAEYSQCFPDTEFLCAHQVNTTYFGSNEAPD
jgi:hypothetical protein